jgi:GAF domain-containing protein
MPSEVEAREPTVEELKQDLAEARDQQTATSEILRVISISPSNAQPVFAEIAESSARLCDAYDAIILLKDGDLLRHAAHEGPIPIAGQLALHRGSFMGRSVLEHRTIHVADLQAEVDEYPVGSEIARRLGHRTMLAVPLMRAGKAIGVIALRRLEKRPFSERQIELLRTFADQAVIAIENARLFEEVQARTRDATEALEYQTATSEVLAVISRSPTDVQPVFDAIVGTARRLCAAEHAILFKLEDGKYRVAANSGSEAEFIQFLKKNPIIPAHGTLVGRTALEKRTVYITDALSDPTYRWVEAARRGKFRSDLGVPLLREGEVVGVIVLVHSRSNAFTDKQLHLVETFADQAVIAIENARLFEAEQTRSRELTERTQELTESLEYQTATSEVLGVISRSPTDLQPVFDAIAQAAAQLCKAQFCHVCRFDGKLIHFAAAYGLTPEGRQALQGGYPLAPGRATATARSILNASVEEVADVHTDLHYTHGGAATVMNLRSVVAVPMLKDNHPIGAIAVARSATGRFPTRQIDLLKTFADQAVIAIENTRLFEEVQVSTRELTEALEQQTATADVLKVISRSALDLQRVLDALVESAARLCNANDAAIFQVFGDGLRLVAHHGQIPLGGPVGQYTVPLVRGRIYARAVIDRKTTQVADLLAEADEYPESWKVALQVGWRTALCVPLFHVGVAIGVIFIRRTEVRPFTERQIELVNTFADQAVIAIENTRLFEAEQASKRELTEALEQQTATADVLKVISRSAFNLQTVLAELIRSAVPLCEADFGHIRQRVGELYPVAASFGLTQEQHALFASSAGGTVSATRGSIPGRALIERRIVHFPDVLNDPEFTFHDLAKSVGFRAAVGVPLISNGQIVGVMTLNRATPGAFSEKQLALLETFADQAVIAIENTRLFEEVQARTRELAKTVEDLEIASQHKSQFVANMSHELRTPLAAILGYAELMQEGFYEPLGEKSLDALTRIRSNGKHLLGLINTVLDIAKIESGQFTLNMGEYAIESVVETVRSATESLAQNKKLALTTEVAKSLPVGLGDEQRLTQVLLNLVGNAIKFTDVGEVRVTAKAVNGHFNFSVADTGPGIPEQERTRIFEQFHQVDSSLTKAAGGTGLGLSIAKQIVEMHGGRIWVESTVGKGSTFQMEIPTRAEFRKLAL